MSRLQLLTVFIIHLVILYTGVLSDHEYEPVCDKSDFSLGENDPALPRLPDQYYFVAEAVIKEFGINILVTDYLDELGNRGRLDSTARGQKTSSISDYNLRETFIFPNRRTGEDCTVSLLTTNATNPLTRFVFGIVPGENNTVHIGSPSFFFNLDNETAARYIGVNVTRGIPSYHWQSCTVNDNSSWTIDYYFTDGSLWNTTYLETGLVPTSVELFGNRLDPRSGLMIDLEHYYTFVDFRSGPESVPDDVFMVPTGLICSGRIPGQPFPEFPDFFSAGIEVIGNDVVLNIQEYYDFVHQLFGYEVYFSSQNFSGPVSGVQDFNIQTQYYTTYDSCTVVPITAENTFYDSVVGNDSLFHLRGFRELLFATEDRDFVYEGVTNVRGLPVDVWIAQSQEEYPSATGINSTVVNATYQIYMTRPGQQITSLNGITTDPAVWQTTFSGILISMDDDGTEIIENISSLNNFYSFSPSEPSLDVYDISHCLDQSEYVRLLFQIPAGNMSTLKQDIRAAIMKYAEKVGMPFISPLQVSSIQVRSSSSNLTVHLHIANVSRNATIQWKYSAQDLLDKMTDGLKNGDKLPFTIPIGNTDVYPLYITAAIPEPTVPPTTTTQPTKTPTTTTQPTRTPTESTSSSSGLSAGAAAGISIATFVIGVAVGILLGLLVLILCQKFNRTGSFNLSPRKSDTGIYERQVDDVIESDLPDMSADKD